MNFRFLVLPFLGLCLTWFLVACGQSSSLPESAGSREMERTYDDQDPTEESEGPQPEEDSRPRVERAQEEESNHGAENLRDLPQTDDFVEEDRVESIESEIEGRYGLRFEMEESPEVDFLGRVSGKIRLVQLEDSEAEFDFDMAKDLERYLETLNDLNLMQRSEEIERIEDPQEKREALKEWIRQQWILGQKKSQLQQELEAFWGYQVRELLAIVNRVSASGVQVLRRGSHEEDYLVSLNRYDLEDASLEELKRDFTQFRELYAEIRTQPRWSKLNRMEFRELASLERAYGDLAAWLESPSEDSSMVAKDEFIRRGTIASLEKLKSWIETPWTEEEWSEFSRQELQKQEEDLQLIWTQLMSNLPVRERALIPRPSSPAERRH